MLLRTRRQPATQTPPPEAEAPPAATRVSDYANAEVWRANRYQRPVAVVALRPQLFSGEQPTRQELLLATKGIGERVRRTDRVGLFRDDVVISLLPETDEPGARSAAHRVAGEMTLRSSASVRRTWVYGVAARREDSSKGDELITAALEDLTERQA